LVQVGGRIAPSSSPNWVSCVESGAGAHKNCLASTEGLQLARQHPEQVEVVTRSTGPSTSSWSGCTKPHA